MALARLTTWSSGQVLTAAALNAEFDNILANPIALISTASVASKGLLLVGNATALIGLPVGSNAQVLTADSTQASGVKWAAVSASGSPGFDTVTSGTNTVAMMIVGSGASLVTTGTGILRATDLIFGSDAKGDIAVRGTSVYGRIAVGSNGQVIVADSTQASGVKWGAPLTSAVATVATSEPTSSTTYIDLPTTGPSATITPGPSGIVLVYISANITGVRSGYVSFAASGGNTIAASDTRALIGFGGAIDSSLPVRATAVVYLTGQAAVSTSYKLQYKTSSGGSSSTFQDREISVMTW